MNHMGPPEDSPSGSDGKELPAVQETWFVPCVSKIPWRTEKEKEGNSCLGRILELQ